jgi:hypothetical protein
MTKKIKTHSNSFLQKRLVFVDQADADDKQLSQESGLEKPEELKKQDSQQEFLRLLQNVYTIDDADTFLEEYGDYVVHAQGAPDAEAARDLFKSDGGKMIRDLAFNNLVSKFSSRVSEKGMAEISALPIKPETEEVTQQAQNELLKIQEQSKNPEMYGMLAESIGSMGMKKEDLLRTNKLNESKQNIEQQLSTTNARLKILQEHISEVNAFEKSSSEKVRKWDSIKTSLINLVAPVAVGGGVGAGLTSFLALGFALSNPVTAVVGSAALGSITVYGIKTLLFPNFGRTLSAQLRERNSIDLKKRLLNSGSVEIKQGETLVQFRVPPSPLVNGKAHENIIMVAPPGTIDGRIVKNPKGEAATGGSIVTGEVLANTELQLGFMVKNLTAQAAQESQTLSLANAEFSKHNVQMNIKSKNFQEKYEFLKKKIKSYEETVQKSTLHLAAIGASRNKRDISDAENEEAKKSETELKAAQEALKESRDALVALDKVKRVFTLQAELKETPVPQGMLESLYSQSLNPDLLKITQKFAKEQDQNTTEAQKKLGSLTTKKLKELTQGLDGASMTEIKSYLRYVQRNWGMKGKTDLKIKFPVLKEIERTKPELFNTLISVSELTEDSRYSKGPKGPEGDLVEKLLSMLGKTDEEIRHEEHIKEEQVIEKKEKVEKKVALKERLRIQLETAYDDLKTIPHLKGIEDIISSNPQAIKDIVSKGMVSDLGELSVQDRVPDDFSPGHFPLFIENLNDENELQKWIKRLEFIKNHTVVKRLGRNGELFDSRNSTLATIPEMMIGVKTSMKNFMDKVNEGKTDDQIIHWDELKKIKFGNDQSRDLKGYNNLLNELHLDGNRNLVYGEDKNLDDPSVVKHLELFEFSFKKLFSLLKANKLAVSKINGTEHDFEIIPVGTLPKESDSGEKEFFYELQNNEYVKSLMVDSPEEFPVGTSSESNDAVIQQRKQCIELLFSGDDAKIRKVKVMKGGVELSFRQDGPNHLIFYENQNSGKDHNISRDDLEAPNSEYTLKLVG